MYLQYSFFRDVLKRVIIHKEEFKSKYKVWSVTYETGLVSLVQDSHFTKVLKLDGISQQNIDN